VCFSSGADLSEFGTAPPPLEARDVRLARDVWGRLATARPILAAVVHGACIGAGLELALLCDLRIAREDAWFALPEAQLGLIPAAGGTQTLPRAVAGSRAVHMLLTSDRLGAEAAYAAGLVSQVAPVTVEPGDLAWQVLARLGDNAPARRRRLRDHWRRGGS
jgi:enoyl-CoA hydratase/carnithine racemase